MINKGQKACNMLKTLQQTFSVYVYITALEAIALYIPDTSDPELLHIFIWALHDWIKQEVCFKAPANIKDTGRIAV